MILRLIWIKQVLDYLGGVVDTPPPGTPSVMLRPAFRGLWWGVLLILIVMFSGQTSKFIYIDF